MTTVQTLPETTMESISLPIWREFLFGIDWLALHASPVYYGLGVPKGDGSGVVLVHGFLSYSIHLAELYQWLRRIGYRPFFSGIGQNSDCPNLLSERLLVTMDEAYEATGRKIHLIGHSLGGSIARSAAARRPDQVAQVITLAAPFRSIRIQHLVFGATRQVRLGILRNRRRSGRIRPKCYTGKCDCEFAKALREELPDTMERLAIYTETDGIADWRSCVEDDPSRNKLVRSTHTGLPFHPETFRAVAKQLSACSTRSIAIA